MDWFSTHWAVVAAFIGSIPDAIGAFVSAELYLVSCFALASTAILCMIGMAYPGYRDNLLMSLGMFILMIACASRCVDIWHRETVPADWFMLHAGLCLHSFGVAVRVLQVRRRRRMRSELLESLGAETINDISRWHRSAHVRDTGARP